MKRILEAINDGINKSLINFDDNGDFKKSKFSLHDTKDFHIGDYVYKDDILGYNNYIGEKVAICVSDEPDKELYIVLNHPLLGTIFKWAKMNTKLYEDIVPDFHNGWKNTLNVLNNYKDELSGTIWEQLDDDEYIPSKEELETIYNNCVNTDLWDIIGLVQRNYWSSSQSPNSIYNDLALAVRFFDGYCEDILEVYDYRSIALLHIN